MTSKKIRELNIDDCLSADGIDSELSLIDDEEEDAFSASGARQSTLSGQLSFTITKQENHVKEKSSPKRFLEDVPVKSDQVDNRGVLFEISSAKIVKQGRSRFVTYSLTISNNEYMISSSVVLQKRYSDFERLNASLQKKFPQAMKDIVFPKKVISGNFKDETIALRSRAFEQYLCHIYTIEGILDSEELQLFFFRADLEHAYDLLLNTQYGECADIMVLCVQIQEKILSPNHPDVISSVCAIAAVYNEMEEYGNAEKYCRFALQAIGSNDYHTLLVPTLQLTIRLCWKLEKSKQGLEAWLLELQHKGITVNGASKLLDCVVESCRARRQ